MDTRSGTIKRSCQIVEACVSPSGPSTRSKRPRLDHILASPSPSKTPRCTTPPPPALQPLVEITSTPPSNLLPTASAYPSASTNRDASKKYPLPSPHWNIDLPELEAFFDYMYERHKLHLEKVVARSSAPSPSSSPTAAPAAYKKSMTMAEKTRFYTTCNVFRELDAGTQDLLEKVVNLEELQPVAGDSSEEKYKKFEDAVFRTILYRMFNKPLTYATLLSDLSQAIPSPPLSHLSLLKKFIFRTPFPSPTLNSASSASRASPSPLSYSSFLSSRESFNDSFRSMQESSDLKIGEALTTSAYMIIATTIKRRKETADWDAKLNILGEIMDGRYWDKRGKGQWEQGRSLPRMIWEEVVLEGGESTGEEMELEVESGGKSEMIFNEIKKYDLFGDFLAFQLLLDLVYLPHLPNSFSLENDDWSSHGKGSKAGLQRMFGGKSLKEGEILDAMRYLNGIQEREWERIRVREGKERREILKDSLPPILSGTKRQLGLIELEHALCEYSKLQKESGKKHIPKDRKVSYVLPKKYQQV